MNKIGDDELGHILRLVTDLADRRSVSEVCKGWWLMEGLSRSSLRVSTVKHLPRLLTRYPNLTSFETPSVVSNDDLTLVARSCPKLETFIIDQMPFEEVGFYFQLIGCTRSSDELREKFRYLLEVGDEGLCAVANGCPKLSKIAITSSYAGLNGILAMIASAGHNLNHLALKACSLVTDEVLEAVGSSSCCICFLSLSCCTKITDAGLRFLASGSCSKTIKQLNFACCREITNDGASHLCKMLVLEELDLSGCHKLTDVGGQAISKIRILKKLKLQNVQNVTERTIVALAKNCINLEVLDLCECGGFKIACIDAFSGHNCLRFLYLLCCSSIDLRGSVFESLALGCPSLESIVVEECWRETLLEEMQESTVSRIMDFRL